MTLSLSGGGTEWWAAVALSGGWGRGTEWWVGEALSGGGGWVGGFNQEWRSGIRKDVRL